MNPRDLLHEALAHHLAGRLAEAEARYRQVLMAEPAHADALHLLGVIAHQTGHHVSAIELIRQAIARQPAMAEYHNNLGNALRAARRPAEAIAAYRAAIALRADFPDPHVNLGDLLHEEGRWDEALAMCERALQLNPNLAQVHNTIGHLRKRQDRLADALAAYQAAARLDPQLAAARNNAGTVYFAWQRFPDAIVEFNAALALNPHFAAAHLNLANAFLNLRQLDEAIAAARRAIACQPDFAAAHNDLGVALLERGELDAALVALHRAMELEPGNVDAHSNRALTLARQGRFDEALATLDTALQFRPDWAEGHRGRGDILRDSGHHEAAVEAYGKALALAPHTPAIETNLAVTLRHLGRHEAAIAVLRGVLAAHPDFGPAQLALAIILRDQGNVAESLAAYRLALAGGPLPAHLHSGYLFLLHYDPACGPAQLLAEHRTWDRGHASACRGPAPQHANRPEPERPLRVGYVSADLREHPVGRNVHPLFAHHAREHFEIHAYAGVDEPDAMSARLRALVPHWHDVGAMSDEALAAQIQRDGIDILVDLSLHTEGNRLLVFARRPAPVQVTFAGYPSTTGLAAIEYRLTDPFLDPPGPRDAFYAERSVRLPHSFWCFDPIDASEFPTGKPRDLAAPFTWGCLNNPLRVTPAVLEAWGRILRALDDSRLVILAPNDYHRSRIATGLERHGIGLERIEFISQQPRAAYLATYRRCDVILDTWPYNGHTSTCEALWMGLPVVTLVGETAVGRGGFSLLSNLGLTELATASPDAYVAKALALARDRPRLAALQADLRTRMEQSPLMDATGFARDIEAAYRTMWRSWCAQRTRHESA